jgi:membrane protease subunit (stomatin/prohibitin family)
VTADVSPSFAALGLELNRFVVESVSLPDDLQKVMDQRIGVNMAGDLGRLTQFETAESLEEAAQNAGGTAGMGVGLGAGAAMAQAMYGRTAAGAGVLGGAAAATPAAGAAVAAPEAETKFCIDCGRAMPERAKFCPGCGGEQ